MNYLNIKVESPLIVGDLHFSEYSSIIRKKGVRLSNMINTLKWVIETAKKTNCDSIFFLGDFFDKPYLNAEELTALQEIKWPEDLIYLCLVGNHEIEFCGTQCSSTHILNQIKNFYVIDKPTIIPHQDNANYLFLPYITDKHSREMSLYTKNIDVESLIVFSHNDIKGVQMGSFLSKEGFDIDDINKNCSYFFNGHIHNNDGVLKGGKILNVGNITGQNFSENALIYPHCAYTLKVKGWVPKNTLLNVAAHINPYAFNFYKLDLTIKNNLTNILIKENSVLSIKCFEEDLNLIKNQIEKCPNIIEYRIIVYNNPKNNQIKDDNLSLDIDHINKFKEYIISQLGNSEYIIKELQAICK